jgi:hypothetical protein
MKQSTVFFVPVKDSSDIPALKSSLDTLIVSSGILENIDKDEFTAIKTHFGEQGNDRHLSPDLVRTVVDRVKGRGAKPFITDTNVLYKGMRSNAVDHLNTAYEHGFTFDRVGAPVIISDGIFGENGVKIKLSGTKHLKHINVAAPVTFFDSVVFITHCKGHMVLSYAGALKNVCMGFATRTGKQVQHSSSKPEIDGNKCTFCMKCLSVCPENAISEKNKKSFINDDKCVGCNECMVACKFFAISIRWEEAIPVSEEKMTEYAYGILKNIKKKAFINFAINITTDCDCMPNSKVIADNIGLFASTDPLAVDRACLDAIIERSGTDIFKIKYPKSDYEIMFKYAEELGVGTTKYELKSIGG